MPVSYSAIDAVPLPFPITDRFDLDTALTYLSEQVSTPSELWKLVADNFAVDLDMMAEAMAQMYPGSNRSA